MKLRELPADLDKLRCCARSASKINAGKPDFRSPWLLNCNNHANHIGNSNEFDLSVSMLSTTCTTISGTFCAGVCG